MYEVLGTLGRGSQGEVLLARYRGPSGFSRLVAVKRPRAHVDASELRAEAHALAAVRHRAIVHVDRVDEVGGRPALILEYVEGASLEQASRVCVLPERAAVELVAEVAGALAAAWEARGPDGEPLHLVHRDLKPSNLRLTRHGEVKLLDFGLARPAADVGRAAGTDAFLPPEVRAGAPAGPAADVYGLGCVLYQVLAGHPFGATSARPEAHGRRVRAALLSLGASPGVAALLDDMLAAAPERRPDARGVVARAEGLLGGLDGESLRAWAGRVVPGVLPPRPGEDGARTVGSRIHFTGSGDRRRAHLALGAAGALATMLVGFGIAWAWTAQGDPTAAEERRLAEAAPVPASAPSEVASLPERTEAGGGGGAGGASPAGPPSAGAGAATLGTNAARVPSPSRAAVAPLPERPTGAAPSKAAPVGTAPPRAETPAVGADPGGDLPIDGPATEDPGRARVDVDAAADEVALLGEGRRVSLPADVPPGTWKILARFPGEGEVAAGSLVVRADERWIVRCDAFFRCRGER